MWSHFEVAPHVSLSFPIEKAKIQIFELPKGGATWHAPTYSSFTPQTSFWGGANPESHLASNFIFIFILFLIKVAHHEVAPPEGSLQTPNSNFKPPDSTPWDGATWRAQIEPVWNSNFFQKIYKNKAPRPAWGDHLLRTLVNLKIWPSLLENPIFALWNSRPLWLIEEGVAGRFWWTIRSPERRTNEAHDSRPFQELLRCITKQGAPLFLLPWFHSLIRDVVWRKSSSRDGLSYSHKMTYIKYMIMIPWWFLAFMHLARFNLHFIH